MIDRLQPPGPGRAAPGRAAPRSLGGAWSIWFCPGRFRFAQANPGELHGIEGRGPGIEGRAARINDRNRRLNRSSCGAISSGCGPVLCCGDRKNAVSDRAEHRSKGHSALSCARFAAIRSRFAVLDTFCPVIDRRPGASVNRLKPQKSPPSARHGGPVG